MPICLHFPSFKNSCRWSRIQYTCNLFLARKSSSLKTQLSRSALGLCVRKAWPMCFVEGGTCSLGQAGSVVAGECQGDWVLPFRLPCCVQLIKIRESRTGDGKVNDLAWESDQEVFLFFFVCAICNIDKKMFLFIFFPHFRLFWKYRSLHSSSCCAGKLFMPRLRLKNRDFYLFRDLSFSSQKFILTRWWDAG